MAMDHLSEVYKYVVNRFGRPHNGRGIDIDFVQDLQHILPASYLTFVSEVGTGPVLDGFFHYVDPRAYASLPPMVFGNDPDFYPSAMVVVGHSAFGELLIWNRNHRAMTVDLLSRWVLASEFFKPDQEVSDEVSLEAAFMLIDADSYDAVDVDGNLMFERCLKAYGPLEFGQIYAPRLHPALGGSMTVDNFRPASAREAMAIAAQAAPFNLVDARPFPPKIVRRIGSAR